MKSFSKLSIDEKIALAEMHAQNTLANPEIMSMVGNFNINPEYVNETLGFITDARTLNQQQKQEYSEQYTATSQRDEKLDLVESTYDATEGIARLVLANSDFKTALKIGIPLPSAINAKIERMRTFYDGVLNDTNLLPLMARFNKGAEALEAEKAEVEVLAAMQQQQQKEKGEAQVATQKRNEAMEKMIARDRELTTLLKIALGKRNDLLETVGLFVRS